MKTLYFVLLLFGLSEAGNELLVAEGTSSKLKTQVIINQDGLTVFEGRSILEISRLDKDTLYIFAQPSNGPNPLLMNEVGMVVRTLRGRTSSVLVPKSLSRYELNYLRSIASVLSVPKTNWPLTYEMTTDYFGTCELTVNRTSCTTGTLREVNRCSHASSEATFTGHSLPLLHLGMDLSGSKSFCNYTWNENRRGILKSLECSDQLLISKRFIKDSSLKLTIETSISVEGVSNIDSQIHNQILKATEAVGLTYIPVRAEGDQIDGEEMEENLRKLCLSPRDHFSKESLWTIARLFQLLARSNVAPDTLKYPCPINLRRKIALMSAFIGGARLLKFTHEQLMYLNTENEVLIQESHDPLVSLAIANLAETNLNSQLPDASEFFSGQRNNEMMDSIITALMNDGPHTLAGVCSLLQKLRSRSPVLFKDYIQRITLFLSPKEACANGLPGEATRILHAVSSLSVRPTDFVASLRPCFATEDIGVQVAAMMSLGRMECDTPDVLELQQLAFESSSDPEIRISAFKGLIECLPNRPLLLRTLKTVLDQKSDNYSKQVASFVWSYLQAIIVSTNPTHLSLKRELEEDVDIVNTLDPVNYDPRQHSRHIQNTWILDPRTSVIVSMDIAWGRASPFPRSFNVDVVYILENIPFDIASVYIRLTGLELSFETWNNIQDGFLSLKTYVTDAWRNKRQIEQFEVKNFIEKVISRLPADYQASGSSLQMSINLLGLPVNHFYQKDFHKFNLTDWWSKFSVYNFHSELLHLIPLLDNSVELVSSGGVPIRLHLSASTGFQSVISSYFDADEGNVDVAISGGFLRQFDLTLGRDVSVKKALKLFSSQELPPLIASGPVMMSAKQSTTIQIPISGTYNIKSNESIWNFRKPTVLPLYFWQDEKSTSINGRNFPVKHLHHCMFYDEPMHVCYETLQDINISGKLRVLQNKIFHPYYSALKIVLPSGHGPIVLQIKGPDKTKGRETYSYLMTVPDEANAAGLVYEAVYETLISRKETTLKLDAKTPKHIYNVKGFKNIYSETYREYGVQLLVDQRQYGLTAKITYKETSKQLVYASVVNLQGLTIEDEIILNGKIVKESNGKLESLAFSGTSEGLLKDIIELNIEGDIKKSKKENTQSVSLKNTLLRYYKSKKIIIDGLVQLSKAGTEVTIQVRYGNDQAFKLALTKYVTYSTSPSDSQLTPNHIATTTSKAIKIDIQLDLEHPRILQRRLLVTLAVMYKKGQLEFDGAYDYGNDQGRLLFFLEHNSIFDYRVIVSVENSLRNISYAGSQELLWQDKEFKVAVNGSWSTDPKDNVGFVIHFQREHEKSIGHIIVFDFDLANRGLKIRHEVSRTPSGSYNHKLVVKPTPGKLVTINTVLIAGLHPNKINYGLSVDCQVENWNDRLRIIGTANCDSSYFSCSSNVEITFGSDKLTEIEIKHTGRSTGTARTTVQLTVENYVDLAATIDVVLSTGKVKLRIAGKLLPWQRLLEGTAHIRWMDTEFADMEFATFTMDASRQMTHFYNSSLILDKYNRALYTRHELRIDSNEQIDFWAAVLQTKIGLTVLNDKHFIRVAVTTPYDSFYTISGEMNSIYVACNSLEGAIVFSANMAPNSTYLLGWDVNFQLAPKSHGDRKENASITSVGSEYEKELVFLSLIWRLKRPSLGESKMNIKFKRLFIQKHLSDVHHRNSLDVIVATETFPDLGRLSAKLDLSQKAFSFTSRASSGIKFGSMESYGIRTNDSVKFGNTFSLSDPETNWKAVHFDSKVDHLGTLPTNFQSSIAATAVLRHQNFGSFHALAQWMPTSAAFNLGLTTVVSHIPGGQVFFKWTLNRLQSRVAWFGLSSVLDTKWMLNSGRNFEIQYNFKYPNIYISDVDSTFKLELVKGESYLMPLQLYVRGHLTVNNVFHWVLKFDCNQNRKSCLVLGAAINPKVSSSFNIQLMEVEPSHYNGKFSVVLDATSHHLAITYRSSENKKEGTITAKSSLFKEANGYNLRLLLFHDDRRELAMVISEGSLIPNWSYTYRLKVNPGKVIATGITEVTIDDYYVYRANNSDAEVKQFLKLTMTTQNSESSINVELPQVTSVCKFEGTINWAEKIPGELSSFFRIETNDNDHIIEIKLTKDSLSTYGLILKRLIYRQKIIKGIGYPFRVELEIAKWAEQRREIQFSVQKLLDQNKELPTSIKGRPSKGGNVRLDKLKHEFLNVEGAFLFSHSSNILEYQIILKNEDTTTNAVMSVESDSTGCGGHIKLTKEKDNFQMFHILLKGNCRRFPSEDTCTATLEQSALGRPRSVTILNSYGESYSELVLDIAKSEEDQVIVVSNKKSNKTSFRVGQFGNNFFHVSYDPENDSSDVAAIELFGHTMQWKRDRTNEDRCWRRTLTFSTPHYLRSYNTFSFCIHPSIQATLQIVGLELNEGPYISLGQIFNHGGIGFQIGTGKLSLTNKTPAIMLKLVRQSQLFEIHSDWQIKTINQLLEDFESREIDWKAIYENLKNLNYLIKGDLAFEGLVQDVNNLWIDSLLSLHPHVANLYALLDDHTIQVLDQLEFIVKKWIASKQLKLENTIKQLVQFTRTSSNEPITHVAKWIQRQESKVQEVFDFYINHSNYFTSINFRLTWIQSSALIRAIHFNDNQSLYALTSRLMSIVQFKLGRPVGVRGFIVNDFVTKWEQILARRLTWDNIKTHIYNSAHAVELFTPVTVMTLHDSGFQLQINEPSVLVEKYKKIVSSLKFSKLVAYFKAIQTRGKRIYARFLFLTSPHLRGSASVFGSERAISWDGKYLSSLLSDSCPHVLVMLTKSPSRTAIALSIHVDHEVSNAVFNFISGTDEISVDSKLNIKLNGVASRMRQVDFRNLLLRKTNEEVRIKSSDGLSLQCLLRGNVCHLEVDGKNFAGTAGLLGVFDFEANTDFMTSGWERPASESEWLSSWKTSSGGSCFPVSLPKPQSKELKHQCSSVFSPSSSLNECLSSMSSDAYREVCSVGYGCGAEKAYLKECTKRHYFSDLHSNFHCAGPPNILLKLKSNQLSERETAFFNCITEADPPVTKTEWYKDDQRLDEKPNIELKNDILIIHDITSYDAGYFRCRAYNSYGTTDSNVLHLDVLHKPICIQDLQTVNLNEGNPVILDCRVKANPPDVKFGWYLKNDKADYIPIPQEMYTNYWLTSKLNYVPQTQADFGVLLCIAENDIGTQMDPCQFEIKKQDSSKCYEPIRKEGVDYLTQEIVIISDSSCISSLKDFQNYLRKQSDGDVHIKLRFPIDGISPDDFDKYDEIVVEMYSNLWDSVSETIEEQFSQDALKVLIIVDCHRKECKTKQESFSLMVNTLRNLGIHVFVITQDAIDLKDPAAIPKKIKRQLLGIDKKTSYLMSHAKKGKVKGKKNIREFLDVPKNNACAELALESNGAVFSTTAFKKLKKANHKKLFQQLIALRILSTFKENYLQCRMCPCDDYMQCNICRTSINYSDDFDDKSISEEYNDD